MLLCKIHSSFQNAPKKCTKKVQPPFQINSLNIITLIASCLALYLPELQQFPCNSTLPTKHPVLNRLQKWIMITVNLLEIVILHPVSLRFICILAANHISESDLTLLELTTVFGHYSTQAVAKLHTATKMYLERNCVKAFGAQQRVTFHHMSDHSCLQAMQ